MTQLVLITGFLGAGKTTLLKQLLSFYQNRPIGVIVNEFGELNIDARLLKHDHVKIQELSNGSIFCACIKDSFLDALIEMSAYDFQYLFVEASGLADPSSMTQIMTAVRDQIVHPCYYLGSVCVLDGEAFFELKELLPAVRSQLIYAGAVVINKCDLITASDKENLRTAIQKENREAALFFCCHCRLNINDLMVQLHPPVTAAAISSNTLENRSFSTVLKTTPTIKLKQLQEFLEYIAPFTYRIKGFVNTKDGNYSISAVRTHVMLLPWHGQILASELILISAVGIQVTGMIAQGIQLHAPGLLTL